MYLILYEVIPDRFNNGKQYYYVCKDLIGLGCIIESHNDKILDIIKLEEFHNTQQISIVLNEALDTLKNKRLEDKKQCDLKEFERIKKEYDL
jgi:hypothetical protein